MSPMGSVIQFSGCDFSDTILTMSAPISLVSKSHTENLEYFFQDVVSIAGNLNA
jgi:hypothetical protein